MQMSFVFTLAQKLFHLVSLHEQFEVSSTLKKLSKKRPQARNSKDRY
jgi:hypothetical protein